MVCFVYFISDHMHGGSQNIIFRHILSYDGIRLVLLLKRNSIVTFGEVQREEFLVCERNVY